MYVRFLFSILILLTSLESSAIWNNIGFYHIRTNSLRYSTTAQSIYAGNCSAITTIKTYNSNSVLINVSANLTVNLTGSGTTTFYSDAGCTNSISTLTVLSGTNSASFYFIDTSTTAATITASASSYGSASQTQTVATNPFVWVGLGGNANWNTAANWSGGAVPGSSNPTLFNGACVSNCSPTINVAVSVERIRTTSAYAGTITQSAGKTLTVGAGGLVHTAGTFNGSDTNISVSGPLIIAGGAFKSTTANLSVSNSFSFSSGSFNANSGTFMTALSYGTFPITPGAAVFNNVKFTGYATGVSLTGTMQIDGDLTCDDSHGGKGFINGGTINLKGNFALTGGGWNTGGTALLRFVGSGTQTFSTIAPVNRGPNLELASSGTVVFTGDVATSGNLTYTSGSLTATGSTLHLYCASATCTMTPGNVLYNNVDVHTDWGGVTITAGSTMKVGGNLTVGEYSGTSSGLNSGTLEVSGNYTTGSNFPGGSALVRMVGTGTISSAGGWSTRIEINTPGSITLGTTNNFKGDWTYVTGTVVTTGSTANFDLGASGTFNPGSVQFNDVVFLGTSTNMTIVGTLSIGGKMNFSTVAANTVNGGTIDMQGDLVLSSSVSGTTALKFSGGNNQNVKRLGGTWPSGNWTVDKSAGTLSLGSAISLSAAAQTVNVMSGAVNMAGYAFSIKALSLNGNTLTKNSGVLTVNGVVQGTGSLFGGTVNP